METIMTSKGPVILDVAHNPDGLEHLFKALPKKKYPIVLGLSKSKDIPACINVLKQHASNLYLVSSLNGRGLDPELLKEAFLKQGFPQENLKCCSSISLGVQEALLRGPFPILVCGTFFIMAEARTTLGIEEPQDPIELSEKMREAKALI